MADLPKFVQNRLAQQAPAGHPDANLLSAFAEQALAERERESVTAHLAQCADCRELLALAVAAQPEPVAAAAPPVTPSARRHWMAEWRWAGALAACCVIAVALQVRIQPPAMEKAHFPAPLTAPPAAPKERSEQPAWQLAGVKKRKAEPPKPAQPAAPVPVVAELQKQERPAPAAQLDTAAEANSQAKVMKPLEPPTQPEQALTVLRAAREALRADLAESAKSKKEVAAPEALALRQRAGGIVQGLTARAPAPSARTVASFARPSILWSINASPEMAEKARGVVERSTDAGKTWEAVPVNDAVSFRAVASTGTHVWAGGTGGALFHSPDAGDHWERVTVSDHSGALTTTIVNIDTANSNVIRISTNAGERWISVDGGGHWTRQ